MRESCLKVLYKCSINLAILLIIASQSTIISASAYSNSYEIRTLENEIDLGGIASVRVDYSFETNISHNEIILKGENQEWSTSIHDGKMKLLFKIQDREIPVEVDVPLGSSINIPVTTGVIATVFTTVSAPIEIDGKASADKNNLVWRDSAVQRFSLRTSDNADEGETISLRLPMKVEMNIGVAAGTIGINQQIASVPIISFGTSPVIVENIQVKGNSYGTEITLAVIGGMIAAVVGGVLYYRKRNLGKSRAKNSYSGFQGIC